MPRFFAWSCNAVCQAKVARRTALRWARHVCDGVGVAHKHCAAWLVSSASRAVIKWTVCNLISCSHIRWPAVIYDMASVTWELPGTQQCMPTVGLSEWHLGSVHLASASQHIRLSL
jgi:hypothetical protein